MAEVTQNDEVVAKVYDLTPNQLLVLIHLKVCNRMPLWGKWYEDLQFLVKIGLIDGNFKDQKISEEGENYINNILTLTIES